jgi:hypothetical protein
MEHRRNVVESGGMARSRLRTLLRRLAGPTLSLRTADRRLIHCPECMRDVVNPVLWHETDDTHWWIRARCGNCGWVREVVASDDEAQRLDRDLQSGMAKIAAALTKLERQRMRADLATLTRALECDLIAPDDFVR